MPVIPETAPIKKESGNIHQRSGCTVRVSFRLWCRSMAPAASKRATASEMKYVFSDNCKLAVNKQGGTLQRSNAKTPRHTIQFALWNCHVPLAVTIALQLSADMRTISMGIAACERIARYILPPPNPAALYTSATRKKRKA